MCPEYKSNRIVWIDMAKAIGLYLMIAGHGPLLDKVGDQFVYAFHMPLFFILSGLLYKPRSFGETIKKDWVRLLCPYLIINFICLLVGFLVRAMGGYIYTFKDISDRIWAICIGLGYNYESLKPVCTPTWFLIALFLIHLILAIGHKFVNRNYLIVLLLSIVISYIFYLTKIDTLVPIDSALMAMPFFCFGALAKSYLLKRYRHEGLMGCVLLMVLWTVNHINGRMDINTCNYGGFFVLTYVGGIVGSLGVFMIVKSSVHYLNKLLSTVTCLSDGSLLIVGFNLMFIGIATKIWEKVLPSIEINNSIGLIIAFILLFCFIPCIKFCNKYFPMILGKR